MASPSQLPQKSFPSLERVQQGERSDEEDNRSAGARRFSELLSTPTTAFARPSPFAREAEGTAEMGMGRGTKRKPNDDDDDSEQQQLSLGYDGTLNRCLSSPELLQLSSFTNHLLPSPSTVTPSPLPTNELLQPLRITTTALSNSLLLPAKSSTSGMSSSSSLQSLKGQHQEAHQRQILRPKMQLNGSSILSIDVGRLTQKSAAVGFASATPSGAAVAVCRQRHSSAGSIQSDTRRNLIALTASVGNALQRTKRELQRTRLWHAFYAFALPIYTVVGALLFQALDGANDDQQLVLYEQRCMDGREIKMTELERFCTAQMSVECFWRMQSFLGEVEDCYRRWHEVNRTITHPMSDFTNAIIYAFSVYTTIGYGTISANTTSARIATVFYGVFGIPLFFAFIKEEGNMFRNVLIWLYNRTKTYGTRRIASASANLPQPLRKLSSARLLRSAKCAGRSRHSDRPTKRDDEGEKTPLAMTTGGQADLMTMKSGGMESRSRQKNARFSKNPPYVRRSSDVSLPTGWKGSSASSSVASGCRKQLAPAAVARNRSAASDSTAALEQRRVFLCGVFVFCLYLLAVSALFSLMTNWDYFTSFYFMFNSVALIGFGDVFPSQSRIILANMFFIVLGVVLFSMCYFILQEEIRAKAFEASRKARMSITKYSQSLMLHTRPWSRRNSPAFDKGSPLEEANQFDRLRKRRQSAPATAVQLSSDNGGKQRPNREKSDSPSLRL
uniref:Ion_trans_2 domain-containing protein n=1 Tax=Globodera pallida TaxID=36090 RepID=A0A183BKK4_GLOPA